MDSIASLILAADRYGAAEKLERTTVSWRLFGDSKKLDALINGSDIQVRRFEAAIAWLAVNWPAHVAWPDGVVRPHVETSPSGDDDLVAPCDPFGADAKIGIVQ